MMQNICKHVSTNLANSKFKELTANLLGIVVISIAVIYEMSLLLACMYSDFVQNMLKNSVYTQCLLQADRLNSEAKGAYSLPS